MSVLRFNGNNKHLSLWFSDHGFPHITGHATSHDAEFVVGEHCEMQGGADWNLHGRLNSAVLAFDIYKADDPHYMIEHCFKPKIEEVRTGNKVFGSIQFFEKQPGLEETLGVTLVYPPDAFQGVWELLLKVLENDDLEFSVTAVCSLLKDEVAAELEDELKEDDPLRPLLSMTQFLGAKPLLSDEVTLGIYKVNSSSSN